MPVPELVAWFSRTRVCVPGQQLLLGIIDAAQTSEGLGGSECHLASAPSATGGDRIGVGRRDMTVDVHAPRFPVASRQPDEHDSVEVEPVVRIRLERDLVLEARRGITPVPA